MSTAGIGFGAPLLPIAKTCGCGRHYSAMAWRGLPLLGVQHLGGTGRGEMRQCACNSTLLLPLTGNPTIEMPAVFRDAILAVDAAAGSRR